MRREERMIIVSFTVNPDLYELWRAYLNKEKINGSALIRDFMRSVTNKE
jgi:hypothetical protein